jgi:peptide-methionine (S)-S-oxide reductase
MPFRVMTDEARKIHSVRLVSSSLWHYVSHPKISWKIFNMVIRQMRYSAHISGSSVLRARCISLVWIIVVIMSGVALGPRNAICKMVDPSGKAGSQSRETVQTAVLAGGCFWGVDAVFKHVKGVSNVVSGYSGGARSTAHYEMVGTGTTGQAESVKITFDPAKISYDQLLDIFFFVAHDPTELNHQGPDWGTQYRSAIFYANAEQHHSALQFIKKLSLDKAFSNPIVTQVVPLQGFYPAEEYHQNFLELHPDNPYIVVNDLPKLEHLRKQFPALYVP